MEKLLSPSYAIEAPLHCPFYNLGWAGEVRRKIDKALNNQKLRKSLGNFCLQVIWPIALLYVFIVLPLKKKDSGNKEKLKHSTTHM